MCQELLGGARGPRRHSPNQTDAQRWHRDGRIRPTSRPAVRPPHAAVVAGVALGVSDRHPAVDRNDRAIHEARRRETKAEGHVRDLLWLAVATQRYPPPGVRLLVGSGDHCSHARVDRSGADAVDGHTVASEFDGEALGQSYYAGLGCRVGAALPRRTTASVRGPAMECCSWMATAGRSCAKRRLATEVGRRRATPNCRSRALLPECAIVNSRAPNCRAALVDLCAWPGLPCRAGHSGRINCDQEFVSAIPRSIALSLTQTHECRRLR